MRNLGIKREKELENYVFKRMSEAQIIGLSIATIQEQKVNYKRGFGFKNFEKGTSPTPETLYCIGSVTKPFTALAIMQLQERGILSLDDPISKYVDFNPMPMGKPILVKHLLSHTSGISSLGYAEATLGSIMNNQDIWFPISSPGDLLVFLNGAEDWVLSKPGEHYAYLNEGYILLGSIIEKVSGMDYMDYVKKNILEPLVMKRSTFKEKDVKSIDDIAVPYISSEDGKKVPTRYPYGQLIADGGLMSSATELSRFLRMLISYGEIDGVRIASEESIKEMMKPRIQTEDKLFDYSSNIYYGYGLRIRSGFFGSNIVYHSGSVFGSSAHIGLIPDEDIGVVILANGGYFLKDIGDYALALLLGNDPMNLPYFKRLRELEDLTGTYSTFRGISNYHVSRSGGILHLSSSFGHRSYSTPLFPINLEGDTKQFSIFGLESSSPVIFFKSKGEAFLVYNRTLAKKN